VKDGAAARRHGVDRHHGRAHAHPCHRRLEQPLEGAVVERDVRAGAAHVEADDPRQPSALRRSRGPHDAAGWPGEDCILTLEPARLGQVAAALHEVQSNAVQLRGDLRDVAPEDGREIGVNDSGVSARHETKERAHGMARADLGEPLVTRDRREALLHSRVFPSVDEGDSAGPETRLTSVPQRRPRSIFVERLHL
jgi:hypothetical protein